MQLNGLNFHIIVNYQNIDIFPFFQELSQIQENESLVGKMKNPSKVILLRVSYTYSKKMLDSSLSNNFFMPDALQNMVGPGEVDDDLEPETAEECSKYGEVQKVVIYEVIVTFYLFIYLYYCSFILCLTVKRNMAFVTFLRVLMLICKK